MPLLETAPAVLFYVGWHRVGGRSRAGFRGATCEMDAAVSSHLCRDHEQPEHELCMSLSEQNPPWLGGGWWWELNYLGPNSLRLDPLNVWVFPPMFDLLKKTLEPLGSPVRELRHDPIQTSPACPGPAPATPQAHMLLLEILCGKKPSLDCSL